MANISWKSKEQIGQEQLEVKIQKLREQRNKLLQETDWLLLRHQDEVSMEGPQPSPQNSIKNCLLIDKH